MNISTSLNSPWQPAQQVKTFGSYDQAELRSLLADDAAAHNARTKAALPMEAMTQDRHNRRDEAADRMVARTRSILAARAAMDAEVMGLIAAGMQTVPEILRALGNRVPNRSVVDRAIASLHATDRIEATGRTRTRGRLWKVAA